MTDNLLSKQLDALLFNEHNPVSNLANASALLHIKNGTSVCGTAFSQRKALRVANVHEFPGHIACDSASNSEIVIPLIKDNQMIGVLDIDSSSKNRFSKEDEKALSEFGEVLLKNTKWS